LSYMSKRILITNFKVEAGSNKLEWVFDQILSCEAARRISQTAGMLWKIWVKSSEIEESGGVYLFEDEASARAFTEQVLSLLKSIPMITDVTVKSFAIAEEPTRITRGPVG
jgi:hypothetical protein